MGLRINEAKTKYMHMSRRPRRNLQSFLVGSYAFEEVSEFKYMGALISALDTTTEWRRIVRAAETHPGL